jgi:chromosome partitioning protein
MNLGGAGNPDSLGADVPRETSAEAKPGGAGNHADVSPDVSRETLANGAHDDDPVTLLRAANSAHVDLDEHVVSREASDKGVGGGGSLSISLRARPGDPGDLGADQRDVSRETDSEANPIHGAGRGPIEPDVSRETSQSTAPERTVSDALRAELAAAVPTTNDDTPLARALARDTKRRITLTGKTFAKPDRPRILTVANQKGGVGKTTTAVNVAAALAQSGLRVLVIDLDPQGNASTALGVEHRSGISSVYDSLVDGLPLQDVIRESPHVSGLFCAPSTIDLAGAEIELVSLVARETRLARALDTLMAGTAYDYVFIDCPPSLGLLTINAFVAAREVFIPIQCEYYALEGLSQLLRNIELIRTHLNPGLTVSTILLTMFDGRTRLSAQVAEDVRAHFPEQTLRTTIPRSVRVSEAPSFGQTVMTYDPLSSGALAYLEAASQIADAGQSRPIPEEGPHA